jgi:hypothetical protein
MDTARQIVRWAVPGWVGILFCVIYVFIHLLFINCKCCNPESLSKMAEFFSTFKGLIPVLGVASIPVGFVIYQLYYWIYWHAPVPKCLSRVFSSSDRGRLILQNLENYDFESLFGRSLYKDRSSAYNSRWRDKAVMKKFQLNWTLSESVWYKALNCIKYQHVRDYLDKRCQFLLDIYHSHGANNVALAVGFFFYLIGFAGGKLLKGNLALFDCLPIFANFVLSVWIYRIFQKGRLDSFIALSSLRSDVITDVFLNSTSDIESPPNHTP